jgi:Lipocalin-like domain
MRIPAKTNYAVTLVVAMAFSMFAHAQSAKKINGGGGAKEKLIGAWHLVHIDAPGADGKSVPVPQPEGMLIYTRDGHISEAEGSESRERRKVRVSWEAAVSESAASTTPRTQTRVPLP